MATLPNNSLSPDSLGLKPTTEISRKLLNQKNPTRIGNIKGDDYHLPDFEDYRYYSTANTKEAFSLIDLRYTNMSSVTSELNNNTFSNTNVRSAANNMPFSLSSSPMIKHEFIDSRNAFSQIRQVSEFQIKLSKFSSIGLYLNVDESQNKDLDNFTLDKEKDANKQEEDENNEDIFEKQTREEENEKVYAQICPSRYLKSIVEEQKFIFSLLEFNPMSFMLNNNRFGKKKGVLDVPAPTSLKPSDFIRKPDYSKEAILEGMVVEDKNGLVLIDPKIMTKFRGVVGDMMMKMIKAFFLGIPVSLSVKLFEPKSTLQRITDYWSHAPTFLTRAALSKDPIEQMKLVLSFALSGLYIPTKQLKPFNPLLGETFEGTFEDGTRVYVEHISHYPTVSSFYIKHPENLYNISGYFEFSTKNKNVGSLLYVYQKGPIKITFKDGNEIIYHMPIIKLINCKDEEGRAAQWIDYIFAYNKQNNLKAFMKFRFEDKIIHSVGGGIYNCEFDDKFSFNYEKEKKLIDKTSNKINFLKQFKGSWLKYLKFEDEDDDIWNINRDVPHWIRPVDYPLPSDGRYREDLAWLHRSFYDSENETERKLYEKHSQDWKTVIEFLQRKEREIRKNLKKK